MTEKETAVTEIQLVCEANVFGCSVAGSNRSLDERLIMFKSLNEFLVFQPDQFFNMTYS
jgi:hypothetical protein